MRLSPFSRLLALAVAGASIAVAPSASWGSACPLGDCEGAHLDARRAGEQGRQADNQRDPDEIVNLPSRSQEPYMGQHGPTRRGDIVQYPAKFERRDNDFVGFFISFPELVTPTNPRGWFMSYGDLPGRGWSVMDRIMQECLDNGITEVWFWNWSGQASAQPPAPINAVMPWFIPEGHTPAMRASWPEFVRKWKARGITFGVWIGGTYIPNHGTLDSPDYRFLTRNDFDYVADTYARAHEYGFDVIGMDATTSLFRYRDVPPGGVNRPDRVAGPRDPGITLALLRHLNADSRLRDVHIVAELMLPPGEHAAEAASLCSIAPKANPKRNMPTIDSLEDLTPYHEVNPGNEQIALITSGPWNRSNRAEFEQVRNRLREMGYRIGYTQGVLRGVGILQW